MPYHPEYINTDRFDNMPDASDPAPSHWVTPSSTYPQNSLQVPPSMPQAPRTAAYTDDHSMCDGSTCMQCSEGHSHRETCQDALDERARGRPDPTSKTSGVKNDADVPGCRCIIC